MTAGSFFFFTLIWSELQNVVDGLLRKDFVMLFLSFSVNRILPEILSLTHFTYQVYCNHAKSPYVCGAHLNGASDVL